MAQWVKCMLGRYENLSGYQYPHKKQACRTCLQPQYCLGVGMETTDTSGLLSSQPSYNGEFQVQ